MKPDRDGQRLDNFIQAQLKGVPRSLVYRLIRTGQVRINGGRAKPATRLAAGDEVRLPPATVTADKPAAIPEWALQAVRNRIVERTESYFVVNKPSGMAVHAGSGLAWGLVDVMRTLMPDEAIELVHRLDRETSGLLLLARDASSLRALRLCFSKHRADKRYLCLVHGVPADSRMVVDAPLAESRRGGEKTMTVAEQGKPALTEFLLLERYGPYSYLEARPRTGRTHQIRAHAAHMGTPLAGDSRYGTAALAALDRESGLDRLFLHAHSLSLEFPEGQSVHYNAPLPQRLSAFLGRL
ncbi:MAG: RluA family pseudouridine synthase [Xanthomonadales bacterium]|nr:RluA family pseudouridine synthase [Xanthomonadales bacterium]